MKSKSFAGYAWSVLVYNLAVILWGAYVRASGSGAGCGSHWPSCNGEIIPRAPQIETLIEFVHRVTSGLSGLLVLILFLWAIRTFTPGERTRKAAGVSLAFIVIEAIIGAGLVKFEWVAQDASAGRAITIVIHLINTFILLASLTLCAWWGSGGNAIQIRQNGLVPVLLAVGLFGTLLVGSSGALTALGDTLFPASSLAEGLGQDFSPGAHFLIRFRLAHPIIAVTVGFYLLLLAGMLRVQSNGKVMINLARWLTVLVLIQLAAGAINVLLLAPIWMQLLHLLLADSVWIIQILVGATALSIPEKSESVIKRVDQLVQSA
jgi:heme A synthase